MKLYKCTIELSTEALWRKVSKKPVYVVMDNKDKTKKFVESHLKYDCKVKNVTVLGDALSNILFRNN